MSEAGALYLAAPANLCGDRLEEELTAAGYQDVRIVHVGDEIRVRALRPSGRPINNSDRGAIQLVVAAHLGGPPLSRLAP